MRWWLSLIALLVSCYIAPRSAQAQAFSPDFDCSKANPDDSIQQLLCHDNSAAMAEITFDQTYYALRQIVGKDGWKALKQEIISDDAILSDCVSILEDKTQVADPGCYIDKMNTLTQKYRLRLNGAALEEATRPLVEHRILQQKLAELGFLDPGMKADAVYGESTRRAIETWQRVAHRPEVNGFLSDDDAMALLGDVAQTPNAAEKAGAAISHALTASSQNSPDNQTMQRPIAAQQQDSITTKPVHYKEKENYSRLVNIIVAIILVLALYFAPTYIALKRGVHKTSAVVLVNVFLGWTFLGWVVALVMACAMERTTDYDLRTRAMMQMLNK